MGLYLCIFDGDEEVEGVEVGAYADFAAFRKSVSDNVERSIPCLLCPALMNHSDCDGVWESSECWQLKSELAGIAARFRELPPIEFSAEWQTNLARSIGLWPSNLYESFIDVDGEPLIERLLQLCEFAIERKLPILFQ